MSDHELSEREREWRDTGSDIAGAAYLRTRLRHGGLDQPAVELLARLGLGAALALAGDDAPDTVLCGPANCGLSFGDPLWTHRAIVLLWERHFLPAWEAAHAGDGRARELLRAYRDVSGDRARPRLPELTGLDAEDAATMRQWLGRVHNPLMPSLRGVLPRAARELDLAAIKAALRADLAAEIIGIALPAGAMREVLCARIELVACEDVAPELVGETAAWLDGLPLGAPRSLRVAVAEERPTFVDLATTAAALRRRHEPAWYERGGAHLVLVTQANDPQNWFARHLPHAPRVSVVHLAARAQAGLETSPRAFLGHMIAKKALDGGLGAAAPRHEPSRGCAFDFCRDRVSLDARVRVGSLCRECDALLARSGTLPPPTVAALLAVLGAAREHVLSGR